MKLNWRSVVGACATVVAPLAALFLGLSSAQAQEGPITPWVGEKGITETVQQIMDREALRKQWELADGLILMNEHEIEQDHLVSDLNSPNVSRWPIGGGLEQGGLGGRIDTGPGTGLPQTPSTKFNGPTLGSSGFVPPDSQGSVGPTQVVACANGRITVYSKTGTVGGLNASLDTFFTSVANASGISDPQVRYDRLSTRWFVLAINVATPNRVVLAVSSGPTITNTASFTFYQFQWDTVTPTNASDTNGFYDYCSLGVDANALYTAGNIFNPSYNGVSGFVIRKSSVLAGGPIVVTAVRRMVASSVGSGPFAARGVDNDDPAATEGYFIGPDNAVTGRLVVRRITNPGGSPTISGNLNITTPTTNNPIAVAALGTTGTLDGIDRRLLSANIRRNRATGSLSLWASHHIQVNAAGVASAAGGRNGTRWYQVGTLTGAPTLTQSGTMFDSAASNPKSFWMSGIAMTGQGHMAVAATVAGLADRPGAAAAGRLSSDPLGTTQATTIVDAAVAGYNAQGSGNQRWGDYAATVVDPTDDQTLWTFVEWCNASNSWAVRVIKLLAPPPALPVSCSPATVAQGASNVNITVTGTSASGSAFYDTEAGFNRLLASVAGTGVTVNSVSFSHATPLQFTMNVSVTAGATLSARTVTATNPDLQTATSAAGVLTVVSGSTCPGFTQNPGNQTACTGTPTSFSVTATGSPAPTLQWRRNTVNIPGATSPTFNILSVVAGDAGSYDCVATNSCGSAPSTAATLTVNTGVAINTQPSPQTVCVGAPSAFTVGATGSPTITYQWRKNTANIGGAIASSYSILSTSVLDGGSYDCVVTNGCSSVTSNAVVLTVNVSPSIGSQPSNLTQNPGTNAAFTVGATGSGVLSYQWRKNTVNLADSGNISGSGTVTLNLTNIGPADAGSYDCVVTNLCGSVTSTAATLAVNACPSDFNGDGFVTGEDFDAYVAAFEAGNISADFNGDGFVTGEDFDAYNVAFEAGC